MTGARDDEGTVTAEFAVALPAVILVLCLALASLGLVGEQVRLQGAVADAARLLGRGDAGAMGLIQAVSSAGSMRVAHRGDLVCADAAAPARLGLLIPITIRARACALDDAG